MKNQAKSTKLFFTLTLAVLCVCVALLVGYTPSTVAHASGDLIDHSNNTPMLEIILDVNGQTEGYFSSLREEDFVASSTNTQNRTYRSRIIPMTLLKSVAAREYSCDGGDLTFVNGFDPGTTGVGFESLNIVGDRNHGIYNSNSSFVDAKVYVPTSGTAEGIRITALKVNNNARILFYFRNATDGLNYPVVIKFDIRSTFAHGLKTLSPDGSGSRAWEKLYLGASSTFGGNLQVITVENNTFRPQAVDLAALIGGQKVLYSAIDPNDQSKGLDSARVYGGYDPQYGGNGPSVNAWTIMDATSLRIDPRFTTIAGSGDLGIKMECINTASGPYMTIQANIPQEKVNKRLFPSATEDKIFTAGYYKDLEIRFEVTTNVYITLVIKVQFKPAAAPVQKSIMGFPRVMNAMMSAELPEYFFKSSLGTQDREGTSFRKIRVYPEDLCEYAGSHTMSFPQTVTTAVQTDGIAKGLIAIEAGIENQDQISERSYLDITALENGTVTINFRVRYSTDANTEEQNQPIDVAVVFNIYGKYNIDEIRVGRNKFEQNVNSWSLIRDLSNDGFYLVGYEITSQNFVADVSFNNNVLVVTPKADGKEDIDLIFRDTEGYDRREVRVSTRISVNTRDGLFWSTWDPFVVVLFWILIGLAIILILCLIALMVYKAFVKSRREQLETTAPASSYIIKLNSTIAAAQAQQRMTVAGAGYQTSQGMPLQLAAPSMAAVPGTTAFQLGVAPPPPVAAQTYGATQPGMTVSMGATELPPNAPMPPDGYDHGHMEMRAEEIFIPLSDDEIIEKIFKEKYEPRGMSWRSFSKSRDLQSRELEKEKQRIRDEVRAGKSIEEACGLIRAKEAPQARTSEGHVTQDSIQTEQSPFVVLLGFDPYEAIVADMSTISRETTKEPKIVLDENGEKKMIYEETTEEESELDDAKLEKQKLALERDMILSRLQRVEEEIERLRESAAACNENIAAADKDVKEYEEKVTDLEVRIEMAPKKEKDRFARELVATKEKLRLAKIRQAEQQKAKSDAVEGEAALLEILDTYRRNVSDKESAIEECGVKISVAQKKADNAAERMQRVKEQQEFERQSAYLSPILRDIYSYDRDIRRLQDEIDSHAQEKANIKAETSALQTQLMSTTDSATITRLSGAISEKNARISKLDSMIADKTKQKSNKSIEFATLRKRANDYIDKENMTIDRVVECENDVIRVAVFEDYKIRITAEKEIAEKAIETLRAENDKLASSLDEKIAANAAKVAADVQAVSDELAAAERQLQDLNMQIDLASEDDKLMMSIDQAELTERIEVLQTQLEETKGNGIKSNLEFKMKSEEELAESASALERAKADYENASAQLSRILTVSHISEISDTLFTPGTGVISRDRHDVEATSLKKQLDQTKSQVEQARIAAQVAQVEAERMMIDAERASLATKAEMERMAAEAAERAAEARREAEAQVAEELNRQKQEAELARQEAELARQRAIEEIERAKQEGQLVTEEAQRAKMEAERVLEEAERARREVETEVESAKREAEEQAERARQAAEEEARLAREEIERVKREAEAEVDRMRLEAETEGMVSAAMSAEEEARLVEKVSRRKAEIAELRKGISEISNERDAIALREKFHALELKLDEDEKKSVELKMLIDQAKNDVINAAEMARLREQANRQPQRVVRKVTERVNRIQRPSTSRPGQRSRSVTNVRNVTSVSRQTPQGARPRPAGAPQGARPRPVGAPQGARPRPAGAPQGARPRPAGAPQGTRPPRPGGTPPRRS